MADDFAKALVKAAEAASDDDVSDSFLLQQLNEAVTSYPRMAALTTQPLARLRGVALLRLPANARGRAAVAGLATSRETFSDQSARAAVSRSDGGNGLQDHVGEPAHRLRADAAARV